MKRIFLMSYCLILLTSFVSVSYCEDNSMVTDSYFNGHFVVEGIQSDKNSVEYTTVKAYFHGLCDALVVAGYKERFISLYGENATENKMFEAIYLYYRDNPTQRSKPIIKVLLNGAK